MESDTKTINSQAIIQDNLVEKKKFRDYLFFFSGQQISILGSSIVSFALIWWLTETTNSELMLGLASLCSLGPFILVAPFSGVIADRVKRKPLLLTVDSLQSLFTVILTIIFMIYFIPNLDDPTAIANKTLLIACVFVTLGLRGAMQAFHSPAVSAMVPSMVPQKHLSRINGASYLVSGVISVIGPAVGAVLLNVVDISIIMWLDIITFAIAVIPLIIIKIPSVQKQEGKQPSFFGQFKEGINVMKDIRGLLAIMIGATLINFFFSPIGTLLPLFVSKVHLGTKGNYALVIGLLQAGVILGGLFMTFFKGFKKKIRAIVICVTILFMGEALLITVPTTINARFILIGMILFLSIIPNAMANTTFSTALQVIVPKEKMGRVFSVVMVMSMAITPIGNFLSGLIGEYVPMGILFTVSAILGIISFLSIYFFSPARYLDNVIEQRIALLKKAEEESIDLAQDEIKDSIEIIERIKLDESISSSEIPLK
ncbi:MAG: MFS transporter [Asgard group archaeon]|nr:MFS transporter [Asgard group archaeon]